jgi:glycosyltransferase involved in cell wall biosynthesis
MSANAVPSVSVIMPVYNSAKYLDAAFASILAQTHLLIAGNLLELSIFDDGSTDTSLQVSSVTAARIGWLRIMRSGSVVL